MPETLVATPAFDREAERGLVAAALVNAAVLEDAAVTAVRPEDFHDSRLALCAIRSYQKYALGADSPLKSLKIKREDPGPQTTLTLEDRDKLLHVRDMGKIAQRQYVVAILVLWDTWSRATESCNLRLEHVDAKEGTLIARRKGGDREAKVMSDETASFLYSWIDGDRHRVAKPGCPTVFVNVLTGGPWTRDGPRGNLNRLGAKAGVEVCPHGFRRGGPTHFIRQGMPTRVAQLQGGGRISAS